MEVNTLAFIDVLLFLAVPIAFLLIPYVKQPVQAVEAIDFDENQLIVDH